MGREEEWMREQREKRRAEANAVAERKRQDKANDEQIRRVYAQRLAEEALVC